MRELIDHEILAQNPPSPGLIGRMRTKEIDPSIYTEWMLLFDWYNQETGSRKGLGCAPCYPMVWMWYQKKMREDG